MITIGPISESMGRQDEQIQKKMSSQGKMVGSKRTSQDHQEDPSQVHKKAKKDFPRQCNEVLDDVVGFGRQRDHKRGRFIFFPGQVQSQRV